MATVRIHDQVVLRSFGAETVLLNLQNGSYHGLNETGGRMLDVVVEVGDPAEAARRLAAEYGRPEDEIAGDLAELLDALLQRALIVFDGTGPPPDAGVRPS